jgi:hypothetical protein
VLLRLAYLGMTNVFALLRLLPVSSRDKDVEILALRHQLSVLQRQLGPDRVRFTLADRALLAALLHRLPRDVLKRLHLVVRPDTVLRWQRHGRSSARPPVPQRQDPDPVRIVRLRHTPHRGRINGGSICRSHNSEHAGTAGEPHRHGRRRGRALPRCSRPPGGLRAVRRGLRRAPLGGHQWLARRITREAW